MNFRDKSWKLNLLLPCAVRSRNIKICWKVPLLVEDSYSTLTVADIILLVMLSMLMRSRLLSPGVLLLRTVSKPTGTLPAWTWLERSNRAFVVFVSTDWLEVMERGFTFERVVGPCGKPWPGESCLAICCSAWRELDATKRNNQQLDRFTHGLFWALTHLSIQIIPLEVVSQLVFVELLPQPLFLGLRIHSLITRLGRRGFKQDSRL